MCVSCLVCLVRGEVDVQDAELQMLSNLGIKLSTDEGESLTPCHSFLQLSEAQYSNYPIIPGSLQGIISLASPGKYPIPTNLHLVKNECIPKLLIF